jgi:2'-5' RNA ligase
MKYVIVYLINGKPERYHHKLVREVGPKFGERYLIENPRPSHVTLKYPFELKNSKKLEKFLREFAHRQKIHKIKIYGFGNFERHVAFLNTKFSKQAYYVQKSLIKELQKIKGIKARKFDKNFEPHLTIAYGNTKKNFDSIWNYLKKFNKPNFNLKFDNIAILKQSGKYWKVYKVFKIK